VQLASFFNAACSVQLARNLAHAVFQMLTHGSLSTKLAGAWVWCFISSALQRPGLRAFDAGTHVRSAATVGGNLALAVTARPLESDLVTVLVGARAQVQVSNADGSRWAALIPPATNQTAQLQPPLCSLVGRLSA